MSLLRIFSHSYGEYYDLHKKWKRLYDRMRPLDLYAEMGTSFLHEHPHLAKHYKKFLKWYGQCRYLHPVYPKPDFFDDQSELTKELEKAITFLEKSSVNINDFFRALDAAANRIEAHIPKSTGDYYFSLDSHLDEGDFFEDVEFLMSAVFDARYSREGSDLFEWAFIELRDIILTEFEPYSAQAAFENCRQRTMHNMVAGAAYDTDAPRDGNARAITRDPKELILHILRDTGLPEILEQYTGAVTVPYEYRFRHQHILGSTGSGKTTLLTYQLLDDLSRCVRGERSIIVMDTKRDLIKQFERIEGIQDRIVSIDAEDSARGFPVAFNILDLGKQDVSDPLEKEITRNSNLSMLNYFFSSLMGEGAELTDRQSTVFYYVLDLCLEIPNANLDTLLDIIDPDVRSFDKYRFAVGKLDQDSQNYFDSLFNGNQAIKTRREIVPRIYGLKRNKSLSRLFMATETKLDLYSELNQGKIILINCAKSVLRDSVEIFGRFMLAMIMFAIDRRQFIPEDERMSTFFYLDEAHDIIRNDTRLAEMLSQVRAYRLGLIISHQDWSQINNPKVRAGIEANTILKFTPNENKHTFDVRAGNIEGTFKAPDVDIRRMPKISEEQYQAFLQHNREKYCQVGTAEPVAEYSKPDSNLEYLQVAQPQVEYKAKFDIPPHIARKTRGTVKKKSKVAPPNDMPGEIPDEDGTDFF